MRSLIEHGVVARDESGRQWQATGTGEAIETPRNVQALLTARIDRPEAESARERAYFRRDPTIAGYLTEKP